MRFVTLDAVQTSSNIVSSHICAVNVAADSFDDCPWDVVNDYLLTPALAGCILATAVFIVWALSQGVGQQTKMQQLILFWHLTNATWWSLGCDVFSGLFAVMPLLNNTYLLIDAKHTLGPPISEPRIILDVVYILELTLHVPVSLLAFILYVKKSPSRFIVEACVSGAQIAGVYAYYLPEGLTGGHNWPNDRPVIWWLGKCVWFAPRHGQHVCGARLLFTESSLLIVGIGAGVVWAIVPILLLARSAKILNAAVATASQGDKVKGQ